MTDEEKKISFESWLSHQRFPIPTTDIIIEYKTDRYPTDIGFQHKEGIILIERKNPPYGLAIPGGFAEYGLTLEENARKEAKEETGLEIILHDGTHPLTVRSNPDRDPRYHTITAVYVAEGIGRLIAGDDAKEAHIYDLQEVERLIELDMIVFDHGDILREYLEMKNRQINIK